MKFRNFLQKITFKNSWKAFAILIAGLILTVAGAIHTERSTEARSKTDFVLICNEITAKIDERLHTQAQLLRSGSALFAVFGKVKRNDWQRFVAKSELELNMNGIHGVGFSNKKQKNQLQNHILDIRNEGFPLYSVWPSGERDKYTSIIYLEPFSGRNLRAFGYDMYSEPVRKDAMDKACDENIAALSGKVMLVQETGTDKQAGTLMYVPVYRNGLPVTSVAERRAAIIGWVYSPHRMDDLLQHLIGERGLGDNIKLRLQIYDNGVISAKSLLFDSQMHDQVSPGTFSGHKVSIPYDFNEKNWTCCFTQSGEEVSWFQNKALLVLLGGIVISLLFFSLFLSVVATEIRAQDIAQKLTYHIKEEEIRFKTVADYAYDWEYWEGKDHQIIYMSPSCHRMSGYSPEEFSSDNLLLRKIIHPEDFGIFDEHLENTHSTEKINDASNLDFRIIKKDGTIAHIGHLCTPVYDDSGNHIGRRVSNRDITGAKQAEESLRESEGLFQQFMIHCPGLVYLKDEKLRLLKISKSLADLLGKPESELLGRDSYENVPPEFAKSAIADDMKVIREGAIVEREEIMNDRVFATIKFPIQGETGKITHIAGFSIDVTALKQVENEIRQLNDTLEERIEERTKELETSNKELSLRLREIEQFIYISSHDLSEPLLTLTNFTRLIHEEYAGKLDETGNKSIDFIHHSATRMRLLLNGLLNYSFLGKDSVRSWFDCDKVVAEVLSDLSDTIKASDASVTVQELPVLYGNEKELKLLFRNLISNAIKFQQKDTRPEIRIFAELFEKEWKFTIEDNGIGIKEQDREKVFIIFKRMVNRDEYEGIGIGLAHCKKIVELHGGKIWVESTPGAGSSFIFTITKR